MSPGEFGTELFKSSLVLLCLRLNTVLSDSVEDCTSNVNGGIDWPLSVSISSSSISMSDSIASSSTMSSVLSIAESWASLIDSGIHCSSVVSLSVLYLEWKSNTNIIFEVSIFGHFFHFVQNLSILYDVQLWKERIDKMPFYGVKLPKLQSVHSAVLDLPL